MNLSIFWIAIFETMVVMWIYGVKRFADDLRFMLDHHYVILWKVLWALTPLGLIVLLVLSSYAWQEPTYKSFNGEGVAYPHWAHGIGWSLTLIVAIQVRFQKRNDSLLTLNRKINSFFFSDSISCLDFHDLLRYQEKFCTNFSTNSRLGPWRQCCQTRMD